MADIFISHVEEDQSVALEIAAGVEAAGYSTWYYERDCDPGFSYLVQIYQAIEQCAAVVLVISAKSLGSRQVTSEVVLAHESGKHFIPVLYGMTHADFQHRQAEWRMALAAASTIFLPLEGVSAVVPRITAGLRRMGFPPSGPAHSDAAAPVDKATPRSADVEKAGRKILKRLSRRTLAVVSVSVAILLSVGVVIYHTVPWRSPPPPIIVGPPPVSAQESAAPAQMAIPPPSSSDPKSAAAKISGRPSTNRGHGKSLPRDTDAASGDQKVGGNPNLGAESPAKNSNRNAAPALSRQDEKKRGGIFEKLKSGIGSSENKNQGKRPN